MADVGSTARSSRLGNRACETIPPRRRCLGIFAFIGHSYTRLDNNAPHVLVGILPAALFFRGGLDGRVFHHRRHGRGGLFVHRGNALVDVWQGVLWLFPQALFLFPLVQKYLCMFKTIVYSIICQLITKFPAIKAGGTSTIILCVVRHQ